MQLLIRTCTSFMPVFNKFLYFFSQYIAGQAKLYKAHLHLPPNLD